VVNGRRNAGGAEHGGAHPGGTVHARLADGPTPTIAEVWAALGAVMDPEVPVVSVVELGMVRDVALESSPAGVRVALRLTMTYSGCPATALIESMVRDTLLAIGAAEVAIAYQHAPAWTTDWMAPEARARLAAYGIAPPNATRTVVDVTGVSPLRRAHVVVPCPRCGSRETSLLSQYGSTACKAQYRCNACLEPFDYFKPH
jgi:ring-1,2-phenylacetyl-CoA epoxidase subunit PaaD